MSPMLHIEGLWKSFAGFVATRDVSFELKAGELHAIIGPNGAGKTTFFNLITGHLGPDTGSVSFEGRDLVGLAPHKMFGWASRVRSSASTSIPGFPCSRTCRWR